MYYKNILDLADVITTNNKIYNTPQVYITYKNVDNNYIFEKPIVKGVELPPKIVSNLQINDIVLCKLADVNDVILIDENSKNYIFSNDFVVIRAKNNVDYRCLYFYFLSKTFKNQKEDLLTGVKKKFVKISTIESLKIPILKNNSMYETINDYWKEYYNTLEYVSNLFMKNNEKLKNLAMYYISGKYKKNSKLVKRDFIPFEIPDTWEVTRLKEVSKKVFEGQKKNLRCTNKGIPILFGENIQDNEIDLTNAKYINEKDSQYINTNFHPEMYDILLNNKNGYNYFIKEEVKFNISEGVILIKPDDTKILPEYLYILLNSSYGKYLFKSRMNFIDSTNVENILIPLPSLTEQAEILEILCNYILKNESVRNKAFNKIKKIELNLYDKIDNSYI